MTNFPLPLHIQLTQMISGYWLSQAIYTVAKLGIADLLCEGSKSCKQLAQESDSNASSLYRIMRALASVKIFAETESEHFVLTPLAEYLRSDHPQSVKATAYTLSETPP